MRADSGQFFDPAAAEAGVLDVSGGRGETRLQAVENSLKMQFKSATHRTSVLCNSLPEQRFFCHHLAFLYCIIHQYFDCYVPQPSALPSHIKLSFRCGILVIVSLYLAS